MEAIPPCVGIAVEYALRIAAKLAALVASGDNLIKLVQGGMAVVDLIQTALSSISQQSNSVGGAAESAAAVDQRQPANTMSAVDAGGPGSSSPMSSGGASGGSVAPPDVGTQTSGAVPPTPPSVGTVPDTSRLMGNAGGVSHAAMPGGTPGGMPMGAMGGGRPSGETDKEHTRKYTVVESHDAAVDTAPPTISST